TRVTVALPLPPGPVAVTVSLPEAGSADGAVYAPALVIVPDTAAQLVTFDAENVCVPPSASVTEAGTTTGAGVDPPPPDPPLPPEPPLPPLPPEPPDAVTGTVIVLLGPLLGFFT